MTNNWSLTNFCRRIRQLGQGMTEFVIIVMAVGVGAIFVYTQFGDVLRGQTAASAKALAGEGGEVQTAFAQEAANAAAGGTSRSMGNAAGGGSGGGGGNNGGGSDGGSDGNGGGDNFTDGNNGNNDGGNNDNGGDGEGDSEQGNPDTTMCAQPGECSGLPLCDGGNQNAANKEGMMRSAVQPLLASLALSDTPLAYRPAKGPAVPLSFTYSQREAYQPEAFHYSNLGPQWNYTGISYIVDDPQMPGRKVQRYMAGGGTRLLKQKDYNAATGAFAPDARDMSALIRVQGKPVRYERRLPDGGLEIYAHGDGKENWPRRFFLTEQRDSAGNALKYQYDKQNRLLSITDASNRKAVLEYKHADPLKITGLVDPAGRRAEIAYDEHGRLKSIQDAVGLVSEVSYRGTGTFVERLETPYGVTRFETGEEAGSRWVEITDALGRTERVEARTETAGLPPSEKTIPIGINIDNSGLHRHNSFYWDSENYAKHKGDYTKARIRRWLIEDGEPIDIPSSTKQPLESRVWYAYQDQKSATSPGSCPLPSGVARVLPDGSTQLEQMTYNAQGRLTRYLDPVGRETVFEYAKNGIALLKIRQKNGDRYDTLQQLSWNDQQRPLSITDAAGQRTQYTYNQAGQLTRQTNALGGTREYRYDEAGQLVQILNGHGRAQTRYTYDAAGNIASETDSEGHTVKHQYDNLNRLTQSTYPDGTSSDYTWEKLDLVQVKDRNGQRKQYEYDALQNRLSEQDALRNIRYGYDAANRQISLADGNGNLTTWERDLQGRVIAKRTADGITTRAEYDSAGRQVKTTDALGQEQHLTYGKDNNLTGVTWRNARTPTPDVRLTWDASYRRVVSISDGTGTTRYRYGHTGVPGALKLIEEAGPGAHNAWHLAWDKAGRLKNWRLGEAQEDISYDALGRMSQSRNNLLGRFDYGYLNDTNQLVSASLRGTPLQRTYAFEANANDRRLKSITQPAAARSFAYQISPEHLIRQLVETAQGQSQTWQYEYDDIGRLHTARRNDAPYQYGLDKGDNLVSVSTPEGTKNYRHDAGNKIKGYQYDANGNRIEDERHRYTWNAGNQLVKIAYKNTPRKSTEFKYDGFGRRVAIIETSAATRTETKYNWCGQTICAARDGQDRPIAYYFNEGIYRAQESKKEYHAKDHLGSIRDALNERGDSLARYDYSPYGEFIGKPETKPEFGYAGMHYHAGSGLYLTHYRAYDPQSGRWLSRDPIEELGGINLYAYVGGNPVSFIDPTGEVAIVFVIPPLLGITAAIVANYFGVQQNRVSINGNQVRLLDSPTRNKDKLPLLPWNGPAGVCPSQRDGVLTQQGQQDLENAAGQSGIDPTDPVGLSQGHKQAVQSAIANGTDARTDTRYGGNCEPNQYDSLNTAQDNHCTEYDAQQGRYVNLTGCKGNDSLATLSMKMMKHTQCEKARKDIADQCFAGGDNIHRDKIDDERNAIQKCQNFINKF
jgi:RHS repeat-associated protein